MSQIVASSVLPAATAQAPVAAMAHHRSFVSHAKLISLLTLLSRVLGMARESVMARYFGAGLVSSAFTVAFKVPNLFRKLLGEGALSAAFIPLYAQSLKSDPKQANRFAADSVNLLGLILLGLTVAGELGLAGAIRLGRPRPETLLVLRFTAIMLPYVMLICGTAFLSGILQVHHRFALPALAPVLLNVIHIGVIVIGARILMLVRSTDAIQLQSQQTRLAYWLAGFVLVAGVLQVGMLLPALHAVGYRWRWRLSMLTPLVKQMLRLSLPVALSAGVLQLSVLVDTGITVWLSRGADAGQRLHLLGRSLPYPMDMGAVARLNWAQFLYQFPLGVFAIAVATAIFPGLSADALDADRDKFRRVLRQGIVLTLWEGFPASIGLILVRYPAIRLLFQHGSFTAADTRWVAISTCFYAAAIWAFSLQQILNRAYYAMHDTMTPLVMSIVTILVNTAVEVPLAFTHLREAGIAAGTLASFAVQAIVMLLMLDRKVGGIGLRSIATDAAKMLLACAGMTAACLGVGAIGIYPHGSGNLASIVQLTIQIAVGGGVYFAVCRMLALRISPSDVSASAMKAPPAPVPPAPSRPG